MSPGGQPIYMWKCICSNCGTVSNVRYGDLISGASRSCGCVQSMGEVKIASILSDLHIAFDKEVTFDTCRNAKSNKPLRFDFEIKDNGLLLEFDGVQHRKATGGWNDISNYEKIVYRDAVKNDWCRENNVQLVRIADYEFGNLNHAYMMDILRRAAMEEDEELVCPA